jgi:hypothetical protein
MNIYLFFKIFKTSYCGIPEPCGFSLDKTKRLINPSILQIYEFKIPKTGYNELSLSSPLSVSRGSFIGLFNDGKGMNISSIQDDSYSDYYWLADQSLKRLDANKNIILLLNAMVEKGFFRVEFEVDVSIPFFNSTYYSISMAASYLDSNTSLTQTFNITNCNFLSFLNKF